MSNSEGDSRRCPRRKERVSQEDSLDPGSPAVVSAACDLNPNLLSTG